MIYKLRVTFLKSMLIGILLLERATSAAPGPRFTQLGSIFSIPSDGCIPLWFTLQDNLYDPAAFFRASGIAFDSISEQRVPIFVASDLSFTKQLTIRRYDVGEFSTEVLSIETPFGVSKEAVQQLQKNVSDTVFKEIRDYILQDTPNSPLTSIVNSARAVGSLSLEERITLSAALEKLSDDGTLLWGRQIDEFLAFRTEQYNRRKWNASFKTGLDQEFNQNAINTTIITVRSRGDNRIVGGIGLVRAPFGRIVFRDKLSKEIVYILEGGFGPVYRLTRQFNPHLAIMSQTDFTAIQLESLYRSQNSDLTTLPMVSMEHKSPNGLVSREVRSFEMVDGGKLARLLRNPSFNPYKTNAEIQYGEIVEPVSFAISKDVNNQAYVRILTHFMAFVLDPQFPQDFNLTNRIYVTYNDLPRLYTPFGFSDTGKKFTYDGMEWHYLRGSGADLLKAYQRFDRSILEGDKQFWQEIRDTFERLLKSGYRREHH